VPAVIRQLIRYTYPPAMCAKVYELMASGRLSSLKIGRSRRIPVEALTAFVSAISKESAA